MPPHLLAIDLGTTTCRAVLFDLEGNEVAGAQIGTPMAYPAPAHAEADPEEWWRAVVSVVRQTLAGAAERGAAAHDVAAIGVAGLMHSPVLLDEAGKAVAPVLPWIDQRSVPQLELLRRETGQRVANASAPRIRWLRDHHPLLLAEVRHLLLPKDYIRYRLTGEFCTDPSDAGGTGMFDRATGTWHDDLVALSGLPSEALPRVQPSASLAGTVTVEAAAETGLGVGTPVAAGGADAFVTRLGTGPLAPGEVCIYLGTATWIAVATPGGAGGSGMSGLGANTCTGSALRWLRDLLADDYESLVRHAAEVPPGAEGLFFLPHLMGERGPYEEPHARGGFVGLTLRHGRGHLARAILEGTAFQIRRVLDAGLAGRTRRWSDTAQAPDAPLPRPTGGVACGGGARSALWMEILTAVTGIELRVPVVVEAGALGVAMLAGAAAGIVDLDVARDHMVRPGATHAPEPPLVKTYDALYRRYCQLDDLLLPWFRGQ